LQFVLDQGIKRSFKVAEILREVLPEASPTAVDDEIQDETDTEEAIHLDGDSELEDAEPDDPIDHHSEVDPTPPRSE
jgi:hypothetical protein